MAAMPEEKIHTSDIQNYLREHGRKRFEASGIAR